MPEEKEINNSSQKQSNEPSPKEIEAQNLARIQQLEQQVEQNKADNQQRVVDTNKAIEDAKAKELSAELESDAKLKELLNDKVTDDTDFNDLSNIEMVKVLGDALEQSMDARQKLTVEQMGEPFREISKNIKGIQDYLITKEAVTNVADARSKYSDFDVYGPDMQKLAEQYPSVLPKDLYLLAKARQASTVVPKEEVESEKPDNLGTRSLRAEERFRERREKESESGEPTRRNSRSMRSFIEDAAERVMSERG